MIVRRMSGFVIGLTALILPSVLATGLHASPAPSSSGDLTVAFAVASPTSTIVVEGVGFTPGGAVYLAVYDRWGTQVYDGQRTIACGGSHAASTPLDADDGYAPTGTISVTISLTTASAPYFTPNRFQDPSQARGPGRQEAFDSVGCGHDLMVRAYDKQSATLSDTLDVVPAC